MAEVRVQREGSLRFVQSSGSGATWATASAPASGLFGYVDGFKYTSAQTITTIKDRGNPNHHKLTDIDPISVTFDILWTGRHATAASGSGATVPMFHAEFRASAAEIGNGTTGDYQQFYGLALQSIDLSEAKDGDKLSYKFVALGIGAPTGSGYLS